ncbi:MAG TPA: DUF5663 domain-containing protein [Candidatus Limnocylindria bacterium]|nr:DUF5663 domain-containing protein [Candidatus Limnocylindria bacterium]
MSQNLDTKTNLNAEEELRKFVDNLVAQKGFDVEPEVMEQIKEDVYDRAENIINATIMANTPPEKLEELDKLLDAADPSAIEEFCNVNIPDLQQKTGQALVQFTKTYLGK